VFPIGRGSPGESIQKRRLGFEIYSAGGRAAYQRVDRRRVGSPRRTGLAANLRQHAVDVFGDGDGIGIVQVKGGHAFVLP
jgi:hypothetical protein